MAVFCKIFQLPITLLSLVLAAGCSIDPAQYSNMFQQTVQQAGGKVFPALVYIKVVQEDLGSGRSSSGSASGSGVLISPDGEVVTNNHVVEKAVSIRCLTNDGRSFDAELVGCDKDTDLALLKLKLPAGTPPTAVLFSAGFPRHCPVLRTVPQSGQRCAADLLCQLDRIPLAF